MLTDPAGISDDVQAALNDAGPLPAPDAKGPDESQWPAANREAVPDTFEPSGETGVKGPDPAEWGSAARAARGATLEQG